jgi:hypothetical protein
MLVTIWKWSLAKAKIEANETSFYLLRNLSEAFKNLNFGQNY